MLAEIDADIIGLQEVDSRPSRSAAAQAPELARRLGMQMVEGPLLVEGDGHYGNAVLSRWPLAIRRRERLPHWIGEPRGFLHAVATPPGGIVWQVIVTHLSLGPVTRGRQFAAIARDLDSAASEPTVLLADLNEWNGWAVGLGQLRRASIVLDGPPTYPAGRPLLRLDRIALRACAVQAGPHAHISALARIASDHLPLWAEIRPA